MHQAKLQQLEQVLKGKINACKISLDEWEQAGGDKYPEAGDVLTTPSGSYFVVRTTGTEVHMYKAVASFTPLEQNLLVMLLRQKSGRTGAGATELERQARRLGEWIGQSLSEGEWHLDVPERLDIYGRLNDGMIPFLLMSEQGENKELIYGDLDRVLRSFIADDTLLVPLMENEWLILAPDRLLAEADETEDGTPASDDGKSVLASLAASLQQMVSGEWGGECHVAVGEPIDPVESMVQTVAILRETIGLGRKFHVGLQVHMPWLVHLERLLSGIPETVRSRFVEELVGRPDLFVDAETLSTLDAFFAMDCNVSETAKRLYIHRNTLLYRLDKIKQETGLDVRSFNDAVLVRILLLLYKVTKRK